MTSSFIFFGGARPATQRWMRLIVSLVLLSGIAAAAEDSLRDELAKQAPPWYDLSTDSWRRVAVQPPEPPRQEQDVGGSLAVADAVAWVLVIAVIAVLVWLAIQLWPNEAPALEVRDERPQPGPARPHAIAELDLGDERDPEAALAAARAAGDWRRAIVWIYALLLVRLDAVGAIRLRKGATNRRYVRDAEHWLRTQKEPVAVKPVNLVPCLTLAISAFEQVYFGGLNATREQVDGLEARVRSTMSGLSDGVEERTS